LEPALPRKSTSHNGRDRLDEAKALLIQNQASFVAELRENNRSHAAFERETRETVAQIKAQMAEIIRVLNEHGQILERLPDAVRERMGFRPPQPESSAS
jgi:hypothetical protein